MKLLNMLLNHVTINDQLMRTTKLRRYTKQPLVLLCLPGQNGLITSGLSRARLSVSENNKKSRRNPSAERLIKEGGVLQTDGFASVWLYGAFIFPFQ